MPAVQVEPAFITNAVEAALLVDPEFGGRIGRAVAAGVRRFFQALTAATAPTARARGPAARRRTTAWTARSRSVGRRGLRRARTSRRLCYAPMRFCLMLEGQEGVTWPEWLGRRPDRRATRVRGDLHLRPLLQRHGQPRTRLLRRLGDAGGAGGASHPRSGWARWSRPSRSGCRRSSRRPPSTVDRISGGRVELGMGAGWWEEEHRSHGFPFPPTHERFEMLEEQLEIVHGLLTEERFTFEGTALPPRGRGVRAQRRCSGRTRRSSWAATVGPRIAALVSRWADEFNTVGVGARARRGERIARVRDRLDADGRSQDTLTTSVMTWCYVGATEDEALRADRDRARTRDARRQVRRRTGGAARDLRRGLGRAGGRAAAASTRPPGSRGSC